MIIRSPAEARARIVGRPTPVSGMGGLVGVGVVVPDGAEVAVEVGVGVGVGELVGEPVGESVGALVGLAVGEEVGEPVGESVGLAVGVGVASSDTVKVRALQETGVKASELLGAVV